MAKKQKAEKIARTDISREPGYMYFLDKQGDVARASMARGGRGSKKKGGQQKKIVKVGVRRDKGYLYFIDKDGDVSRTPMARR